MYSKDYSWRYSITASLLLFSPFDFLASLGMDMYLPVVPFMAEALGASSGTIQLTLTVYLVLLGASQLLFGPLSDRFGRRPVLLSGGIAYIAASFALSITSSSGVFLSFRIVQACGAAACLVATFATIRDVYSGRKESNMIYGLLAAMLAMVPAVGPLLGTLIDGWLGWRAIFSLLGSAMAIAVIAAWLLWPETRQQQTHLQWSLLLLPIKRLNFWLYTLCYSAGMGSFFVFFSTAPWIMMNRQGLSQFDFSLLFATVAIVMMIGSRITASLTLRKGNITMLRTGMYCLIAGAIWLAFDEIFIPNLTLGFIVPMWFIGAGIAIAVSIAPNGALQGLDNISGTATAIYFCLGGVILGGTGTLATMLLSNMTAWPIVAYSLILATIVLCLSCFNDNERYFNGKKHGFLHHKKPKVIGKNHYE